MRRFSIVFITLAIIITLGVMNFQTGFSQETASPTAGTPEATPEIEVSGFLGERLGGFKSLQARGLNQIIQRHVIQPGGYVGPHIRPGETIYFVESGTLRFTLLEGEARVEHIEIDGTPTLGTPIPIETISAGMEITLNAGDTIYFDESALQTVMNDGDVETVVFVSNLRPIGVPARLSPDQMATPGATPEATPAG